MRKDHIGLGVDLGTSGVRIVVANQQGQVFHSDQVSYRRGIEYWEDWQFCCETLIKNIPRDIKKRISVCAVDGTSGTLLACDLNGNALGKAIPYNLYCKEQDQKVKNILSNATAYSNACSGLSRALRLIDQYGNNLLLRHQADWINGWFLGNWKWGEAGSNIRLGWDLTTQSWPVDFDKLSWKKSLPEITNSGTLLGKISYKISKELNLSHDLKIIAGTTDSNAAVLAADIGKDDGVTVLGSTIVLKRFVESPIKGIGITNHLLGGQWLCGGASNAGGSVLRKFFEDKELKELSRQINPDLNSGINLRPLPSKGERFPINDPNLQPVLEPRPVSDALYLHALFEGLSRIEKEGWEKLSDLGVPIPKQIITIGGGAKNTQWRRIRERTLGIPIRTCTKQPALGMARLGLNAII